MAAGAAAKLWWHTTLGGWQSMRKTPLGDDAPVITRYFTDRTDQKERFRQALNAREGEQVPVIAWYGVGGAGKSSLVRKLRELLRTEHPDVPHALWDFNSGFDPEKVLTGLRNELVLWSRALRGKDFAFPRFDVAQSVLSEKMGEATQQGGTGRVVASESLAEPRVEPIYTGGPVGPAHPNVPRLRTGWNVEAGRWREAAHGAQEVSEQLVWAGRLARLLTIRSLRRAPVGRWYSWMPMRGSCSMEVATRSGLCGRVGAEGAGSRPVGRRRPGHHRGAGPVAVGGDGLRLR